MTTVGEFIPLNVQNALSDAVKNNIHKLRPGVVRRNRPAEPEPDRKFVDMSGRTMSEPEPGGGAEPVATKKKRTRSPESIAKMKATLAAKKAAGQVGKKKRASKKVVVRRPIPALPATPRDAPVAVLGHEALEAVTAWLDPIVRNIVREEIRRMLS